MGEPQRGGAEQEATLWEVVAQGKLGLGREALRFRTDPIRHVNAEELGLVAPVQLRGNRGDAIAKSGMRHIVLSRRDLAEIDPERYAGKQLRNRRGQRRCLDE